MTIAVAAARSDLDVARAVLTTEAAGLRALAAGLDGAFLRAVDLLAGIAGRVAVSGMGKSGLVGRKVAATLASTGSPALFVHPAEASHGDLGMIVAGDAVLAISNSGETAELADLVAHARRFGLPLVAMTGRADSALARAADVALLLPAAPGGLPDGARAHHQHDDAARARRRARRRAAHTAGLHGRLISASSIPAASSGPACGACASSCMTSEALPLASPDMPMDRALLLMTGKGFGVLGRDRTRPARLIGIITDGDLRRHMGPDLLARPVHAVMTARPRTIGPEALAADALHALNAGPRPITSLFVVDEAGRPVGLIHVHDLLRAGDRMSLARAPSERSATGRLLAGDGRNPPRRAPSPAGIARRRWMVRWSKRLLPVLALALLSSLALWPELNRQAERGPRRLSPRLGRRARCRAPHRCALSRRGRAGAGPIR